MITVLFIMIGLGFLCWAIYRFAKKNKKPQVINLDEYRTALHESGHAVIAWSCSSVTQLKNIYSTTIGGLVFYDMNIRHDSYVSTLWCKLVITLGGMAAETIVFGKVRSGPSAYDLNCAKLYVQYLAKENFKPPCISGKNLPFNAIYKDSFTKHELVILEAAYNQAKEIINSYGKQFYHLGTQLHARKTLTHEDITAILGPRTPMELLAPFTPTFVYRKAS